MSELQFIPLGGMGAVTQNMYAYVYEDEILLIDCGIGFPDHHMPGVDILLPDISPLLKLVESGKTIVGMALTHGHDDHIAALPYLLPRLPSFPIVGSALTIGFARNRVSEANVDVNFSVIQDGKPVNFGSHFSVECVTVTHSVPDTKHLLISTPVGTMYHGSDFKLDPDPVDGELTDFARIERAGNEGILCMMIDCLRVERRDWVKSESSVGPTIEAAMSSTKGKFIVTLMSSHIHRIQHVIDAAAKHGRKIAFIGRSVEQNVKVALELNKMHIPAGLQVDKRDAGEIADNKICLVVAGSQGQEGSSLVRAVFGDHPMIQITPNDKVIFSADAIPGNEVNYFGAIDELARNGIEVYYPDVEPALHQSGHASAPEQQDILKKVHPKLVMPIGGNDRHRVKFIDLVAKKVGMTEDQVLIPGSGDILAFSHEGTVRVADHITIVPQTVDGLGIGDVGPMVLSDRKSMSAAGIIVVAIPRTKEGFQLKQTTVISRGFVFMREADDVVKFIKDQVAEVIAANDKVADEELRRKLEKRLAKKLYQIIRREPLILPVFMDV